MARLLELKEVLIKWHNNQWVLEWDEVEEEEAEEWVGADQLWLVFALAVVIKSKKDQEFLALV